MPDTNDVQILERIRLDGKIEKLVAASRDDNVVIQFNGVEMTLTSGLQELLNLIAARTSPTEARAIASEEIAKLINGAPETLDTLKELADALAESDETVQGLIELLGNKVDKVPGMGLSEKDFTQTLYDRVMSSLSETDVDTSLNTNSNNPIANSVVALAIQNLTKLASPIQDGLMSKEDKTKLDSLNQIWIGESPPDEMLNGDLFIQFIGD